MRKIDCRRVCREIEEADVDEIRDLAIAHLEVCFECMKFCKEHTTLRQLTANMGTIEAPADFEYRLRARLARQGYGSTLVLRKRGLSLIYRPLVVGVFLLIGAGFLVRSLKTNPNILNPPRFETASSDLNNLQPSKNEDTVAAAAHTVRGLRQPAAHLDKGRPRKNRSFSDGRGRQIITGKRGNTPSIVLQRDEAIASARQSAAFPIAASSQSLEVSLDLANGLSRTISLPGVSFGSQSLLSSTSPGAKSFTAPSEGVW